MKRYGKESKRIYDVKPRGRSKPLTSLKRFTSKVSDPPKRSRPLRDEVKLWLDDSDDSVKVARDNFALGNYHVAAFYTHQTVEKALKAAIIALKHKAPSKTHRLRLLYSEVATEVPLTAEQLRFLGELTPVARRARYVDVAPGLPSEIYTKEIVDQYMKKALPIIDAIKARIAAEGAQ